MKIKLITLFCLLLLPAVPLPGQEPEVLIRHPAVAGQFYPGDPDKLKETIIGYLSAVPDKRPLNNIIALVAPHAGYVYSGPVAAHAFKPLSGKSYDVVVIIGKSHHEGFPFAAVYPSGRFVTPLGTVEVNREVAEALINQTGLCRPYLDPHGPEHSLEVELPFLQTVLEKFTIVPILTGFGDLDKSRAVADALAEVLKGKNALIVCSTDLTHYPDYDDACRVDKMTLESWKTMDPDKILSVQNELMAAGTPGVSCTMCGNTAVLITIMAAKKLGAKKLDILNYANSGDARGTKARVVGYGAALITK